MNRATIRAKVQSRVATNTDDPFLTETKINDLINDALREISSDGDWTWLHLTTTLTTSVATSTYSVPNGFIEAISLTNAQGEVLTPVNGSDLDALNSVSVGLPLFYAVFNRQIVLAPVPSTVETYTLRYKAAEVLLDDDADEPKLPEHLVDALIWYTCHLCMIVTRDDQRASDMYNQYQLARRRMETQPSQVSPPPRLRRRPNGFL